MESAASSLLQSAPPGTSADMVLPGKNGFLFLTNDASQVMEQVEGRKVLSAEALWGIAMSHVARRHFCSKVLRGKYSHWLVPDRETVLSTFLPDEILPHRNGPRSFPLYRTLGCEALHRPYFDQKRLRLSPKQAYFRTDTHWTWHGCFTYLQGFAEREMPAWLDAMSNMAFEEVEYGMVGDLGGKVAAGEEQSSFGIPSSGPRLPLFDNGIRNMGHIRYYRNDDARLKDRVLILHDSFGEWLTTILPHIVRECVFIHSPDFDPILLKRFHPSLVLLCQVERFFIRPLMNGVSMDRIIAEQEEEKGCQRRFAEFDWSDLVTDEALSSPQ